MNYLVKLLTKNINLELPSKFKFVLELTYRGIFKTSLIIVSTVLDTGLISDTTNQVTNSSQGG